MILTSDSEDQTFTVPTGWGLMAEVDTAAAHSVSLTVLGRISDGTETGTVSVTTNAAGVVGGTIIQFTKGGASHGAPGAAYFAWDYVLYPTLTSTPDAPSVAVTLGDWMSMFVLLLSGGTSSSNPPGYTIRIQKSPGAAFMQEGDLGIEATTVCDPGAHIISGTGTGVIYTIAFTDGATLIEEDEVLPESDDEAVFWDTYPTGSQPLWEQVSETTPDDGTYIYATDPNP